MGRAEAGTPKAIANAAKAKGLGRLRWYCAICQKQCRDDNGFKMHTQSESHLRQALTIGEDAGKHIDGFSQEFQSGFVSLLSRRYNTKRILANHAYQEYIADRHHVHMNATKWMTLSQFCKHLGQQGIAIVDEDERGFWLTWIDNSPRAIARQDAASKKASSDRDDESRNRKFINEQIERANAEAKAKGEEDKEKPETSTAGIPRLEGGEKIKLNFSFGAPQAGGLIAGIKSAPVPSKLHIVTPAVASTSETASSDAPQPISNSSDIPSTESASTLTSTDPPTTISIPVKSKVVNIFKSKSKATKPTPAATSNAEKPAPVLSNIELVMLEDQERKRRMNDRMSNDQKRQRID